MKRIFIPFGIFVCIIAGVYAVSFMLPWEKYKETIVAGLEAATGRQVVINGAVSGSLLPLPHVVATNVQISNMAGASTEQMVQATALEVQLKILPLLQGKVEASSITLNKAVIQLEVLENGKKNWDFSEVLASSGVKNSSITALTVANSEVILRKNSSQFLQALAKTNLSIDFTSLSGPFAVTGSYLANQSRQRFTATIGKKIAGSDTEISWQLSTPYADFAFAGKMAGNDANTTTVMGKLTASTSDINNTFYTLFGAGSQRNREGGQPLKATADALFTGKEITLDNVLIDSPVMQGSGRIKTFFDATPIVDIILNIDTLNIDALQHHAAQGKNHKQSTPSRIKYSGLTLPNNINALLYMTLKRVTYHGKDIENIVVNSDLFNGGIEIYPSVAQLPDNTKIEVAGSITSNGIRPAFDGTLVMSGAKFGDMVDWLGVNHYDLPLEKFLKFTLKTQVSMTPKEVRLSEMDAVVDQYNISGLLNVRHGSGIPEINTNIMLNTLNLDDTFIVSKAAEWLQPFYEQSMAESGGEFQWLRKFPVRIGGEVTVADLQYNKRLFRNPLFIFHVVPGSVKWDKIAINSDMASFNGEAMLDIRALRPKIHLNLKGDKLDMAIFSPPVEEKQLDTNGEVDAKASISPKNMPRPAVGGQATWSPKEFHFWRFDKFDGDMQAVLEHFIYQNIPIKKLETTVKLGDGVLSVEALKGKVFDGMLLAKGGMGFAPPSMSFSFALANGKLEEFLTALTAINSFSGYFSVSGSLTMQGSSPAMWVAGLESGISLAVRDMKMQHFNLHNIVETADKSSIATKADFDAMLKAATTSGETLFRNVDGKISVAKGIMQLSNMQLRSDRTSGVISGSVDMNHWLMNMISQFSFIPQGYQAPLSMGIALTGAVEAPTIKLDTVAVESYILSKNSPTIVPAPANQNSIPSVVPAFGWRTAPSSATTAPAAIPSEPAATFGQ